MDDIAGVTCKYINERRCSNSENVVVETKYLLTTFNGETFVSFFANNYINLKY